jgi:ribosomal RNA-processing protein 1
MSDKPLVQQALASSLALLTLDVRPKDKKAGRVERFRAAMCYLRGFWEAVVREWAGLDRLR